MQILFVYVLYRNIVFLLVEKQTLKSTSSDNCDYFFHNIWVVWHYNTIWWPKSSKYLYVLINILSFERRSWKKNCHRFNFIVFFCIISYDYMVINMKIFGLVNNSRESSIYFSLLKATIQEMLQSLILFSIYILVINFSLCDLYHALHLRLVDFRILFYI